MRTIKKQTFSRRTSITIITIAGVFLLVGAYLTAAYTQSWWPFAQTSQGGYVSPTPEDDDDFADDPYNGEKSLNNGTSTATPNGQSTNTPSGGTNTLRQTDVGIASAGIVGNSVEIRAFLPAVVEGDGTCTATLQKDNVSVEGSAPAFINASSSQCEPILIDRSKFSSGTWSVVVSYTSSTSTGTSPRMDITL